MHIYTYIYMDTYKLFSHVSRLFLTSLGVYFWFFIPTSFPAQQRRCTNLNSIFSTGNDNYKYLLSGIHPTFKPTWHPEPSQYAIVNMGLPNPKVSSPWLQMLWLFHFCLFVFLIYPLHGVCVWWWVMCVYTFACTVYVFKCAYVFVGEKCESSLSQAKRECVISCPPLQSQRWEKRRCASHICL